MMRLPSTTRSLAALLVLASLPAAAPQSERVLREDLEFARGLASDWQFVELAEAVLSGMDTRRSSERFKEEIALARCEVYASAARRERDDSRREGHFDKALEAYRNYLDENRFAENRPAAERDLVDLATVYGLDLFRLQEDAVGEEAARLAAKISEVLDDTMKRSDDLAEKLQAEIESERRDGGTTATLERDRYVLLLNRGQMLLTLSQVGDQSAYYYEKAIETLEDVASEAGDQTSFGLNAYLLLGQVYASHGEYSDAADYVQYVVDSSIPVDPAQRASVFDPLPQGVKEANWRFVDRATGPLVDALAASGDVATACLYGLHFRNCVSTYGFEVSRPLGYQSMLSVARALIDSGGFVGGAPGELVWYGTKEEMEAAQSSRRNRQSALDLALQMAQEVNTANRGNVLQLAAQKTISAVVARGVAVNPEVLFEAAQGSYFEREYATAVAAFKRVLSVLSTGDDATRTRLGPEVLWHIGRSYQEMGRPLEAAMTFRTALEDRWHGDPRFDEENAKQYYKALQGLRAKAPDDAVIESMHREAQDLVLRFANNADSQGSILYRQGEIAYAEKEFEDARERFLQVPPSAPDFEKGKVYAAVCLYRLGRGPEAAAELATYLETFVNDPVYQPTTESAKTKRRESMALATYWAGRIAFEAAEQGSGDYDAVLRWLDGYADAFPAQSDFGPKAMMMVTSSLLAKGDFQGAEERLARLEQEFPEDSATGVAAYELHKAYSERRDAAEKAGDAAEVKRLTRRMAESLGVVNRVLAPKLNNLRREAQLWAEIEAWKEAEAALDRALREFKKEASGAGVPADLAHAKLALKKVGEAAALLEPIVNAEGAKPSKLAARDWARAVTGWVEGTGTEILEIPGIGDQATLPKAAEILVQLANTADKWSCDWYGLQFEVAYAYFRWGQLQANQLAVAKGLIEQIRLDLSVGLDDPSKGWLEIDKSCGSEVLRQRFLWLSRKL